MSSSKIFWGSSSEAHRAPHDWWIRIPLMLVSPEPPSALPPLLCCNPCRRTLQISCGFCGVWGKRRNIQRMSNLPVITEFQTWEGRWSFPDCMEWMIVVISDEACSVWHHHLILSGCSHGNQVSSVLFSLSLLFSLPFPWFSKLAVWFINLSWLPLAFHPVLCWLELHKVVWKWLQQPTGEMLIST